MHHTLIGVVHVPAWVPVQALSDIEFLVKESEVLTGEAGRCFLIAGADRLTYRVHPHPLGLKVERLAGSGRVLDRRHLLPWEFEDHSLAHALAFSQLFTASVPCETRGTD